MSDFPYGATAVFNQRTVSLMGRSSDDHEREYQVWIDGFDRGGISLSAYYVPGLALSAAYVAIWSGRRVYLCPLTRGPFRRIDQRYEVHVAYPVGDRWCFVCELSVVVFDPGSWTELTHYDHDEVLGRSWWSNDQLLVEDFQGHRLTFHPKADPLDLTPHPIVT
jgi:hypothetical protein